MGSRVTLSLPVQGWSDGRVIDLRTLVLSGRLTPGKYGVPMSDAGEAAVRVLLEMGARFTREDAADADWALRATLPDGSEARVRRPLGAPGAPLILVDVNAPPQRAEALARGIYAMLGESALKFANAPLLRRHAGEPDLVLRVWRDLLARTAPPKVEIPPPPGATRAEGAARDDPPGSALARRPPLDALAALGLKDGAEWRDVQKSYRRLALKFHPDRTGGNPLLSERFAHVTEAYERLRVHFKGEPAQPTG